MLGAPFLEEQFDYLEGVSKARLDQRWISIKGEVSTGK